MGRYYSPSDFHKKLHDKGFFIPYNYSVSVDASGLTTTFSLALDDAKRQSQPQLEDIISFQAI